MRAKDMTVGKPWKLILEFALPMMMGNICQQLYTVVDAAFVGQIVGFQALGAIGTADWLNWMILGIVFGFTQGFSILISQRFGAGDEGPLKVSIGNAITLTGVITGLLMVTSQVFARPFMELLNTPRDVMPMALIYVRIIYAAMPVLAAYNVQAAILRAVGDSRTPFVAMVVSSLTNIALDALFVMVLHMEVAGAALGTALAQAVSCMYNLRVMRKMSIMRLSRVDFVPEKATSRRLFALGLPGAVQNTVIGLGGLAVQRVINGLGSIFLAGFTATNKLYGLMEMAATSYGSAIATYAGQNYGARRFKRIRRGVNTGVWMSIFTSAAIAVGLYFAGRPVLSLFVSEAEAEVEQVLDVAQKYLNAMLIALPALYLLYVYRSALSGMGDTITPLISGVVELVMRVSTVLFLPLLIGQDGVYFAEAAAWAGAEVILMCTYYIRTEMMKRSPKFCDAEAETA